MLGYQFDALLKQTALIEEVPSTPDEEYWLERVCANFQLDLPSWRSFNLFAYPADYPAGRGPHVSVPREQIFYERVVEPLVAAPPADTEELWRRFYSELAQPEGPFDYLHGCNACNLDGTCGTDGFCKYVTFQSFSRYLRHPEVAEKKKWGAKLRDGRGLNLCLDRLQELIAAPSLHGLVGVGPPPRPGRVADSMFVTRAADAPHRQLPPGITLGTNEAARYVVGAMGLPNFETIGKRSFAGGLLAVQIPAAHISAAWRPTVLEAARDGYYFLPGPVQYSHGMTWPLDQSLARNQPGAEAGFPEWIACSGPEFSRSETTIEVIGVFTD